MTRGESRPACSEQPAGGPTQSPEVTASPADGPSTGTAESTSGTARAVVDWLAARLAHTPEAIAYWQRGPAEYSPCTWRELLTEVFRAAAALQSWGVGPGDRVAQLAENRTEWIVLDLATHLLRAIHVPIHASLTAAQVAFQIDHSGAQVVCCSTAEQLAKVAQHFGERAAAMGDQRAATGSSSGSGDLPGPQPPPSQKPTPDQKPTPGQKPPSDQKQMSRRPVVAVFDQLAAGELQELSSRYREVAWLGWRAALDEADVASGERLLQESLQAAQPTDIATILYTSGTTGEPKGVMLSQSNLVSNADATQRAFGFSPTDVRLTFLPLSHIFARTCDLYTWLARGLQLALAGSRETVLEDARTIRPTVMNGVPYFFEVVRRKFLESDYAAQPDGLRTMLGGRLKWFCSGGAALPVGLADFFAQHSVPILQGYGLTESSPVITLSTPGANRRGASGKPLPGVEVRLAEDGEIWTRGPHVMQGYWQNAAATAAIIQDGWLCTGDYGSLDDDGFLSITGRKKELIVTSIGKNIAPVQLETLIGEDPLVHQVMVVGDNRNYLTALIVPAPATLRAEIIRRQIPVFSPAQALAHPDVIAIYQQIVNERLSDLAPYEQVRKVTLIGRAFSIEEGELTPKMSLRRGVIAEHFQAEIDRMY